MTLIKYGIGCTKRPTGTYWGLSGHHAIYYSRSIAYEEQHLPIVLYTMFYSQQEAYILLVEYLSGNTNYVCICVYRYVDSTFCWNLSSWDTLISSPFWDTTIPDSKIVGANMGPTWVLSAPDGPTLAPWILLSEMAVDNLTTQVDRATVAIGTGPVISVKSDVTTRMVKI